ncbi:MAG: hypothetical protein PsegKO_26100 [Pseudohongiellaceae bacterium]|jgi:hypothetical protein
MRKGKIAKSKRPEGQSMKEHKWDDFESAKDILEATTPVPEDDEVEEQQAATGNAKSRVTEMRRRIEERLDSKRIALECDYLEMEDYSDEIEDPWNSALQ